MQRESTVFIVEDDAAVRESLEFLIGTVGLRTQSYSSATELLDEYDSKRPGCLVADVRLRGMSGVELLEELNRRGTVLPTIIITAHGDMYTAVRAMKSGALDCVAKPLHDQQILDLIQLGIKLDLEQRDVHSQQADVNERLSALSARERDVLAGIVEGKTSLKIASELGISKKTVDVHRSSLMSKMKVHSVAELVKVACTRVSTTR